MDARVVLLAASLGGLVAIRKILSELPADFPVPIVVVLHRTTQAPNLLVHVLARETPLRVKAIVPDEALQPGTVYVAPPDRHAIITNTGRLALRDGRRIKHVLSSADPLFTSAAQNFHGKVVAVVLTGTNSDAAAGARAVKDAGGVVIAQDILTSESFEMPRAAIEAGAVDTVLPLGDIASTLIELTAQKAL
jgi:two-component system, chemotaxis family, protein-glutamate methylesterase/glutaminase